MTDAERQAAFRKAIDDAQALYGYCVAAQLATRQYGPMFQVEPQLVVIPVEDWKEPETKEDAPTAEHSP